MVDAVGLDFHPVDVGHDPDGRFGFLGDADPADVIRSKGMRLALEDRIEFGLEDIHVDPTRLLEFAGDIFPELPDVDDDTGEGRVGVIAKIDDFHPEVLRDRRGRLSEEDQQGRKRRENPQRSQFISIL